MSRGLHAFLFVGIIRRSPFLFGDRLARVGQGIISGLTIWVY